MMLIKKQKLAKNIILNHIKRNLHIKMEKQPIQVHSPQKQNQNAQVQSPTVFKNIIAYLNERKTPFELIEHESASTSAESAQIRNTPLEWGSKTMLVRGKNSQIVMLLYRANSKVSWNKVRKIDYVGKKSKMLTKQQLYSEFGLYPGAVPPFANILKIKGIIDSKFGSHQKMAFNAGLKSKSIIMDFKDFPLQTFEQVDITEDEAKKE